MYRLKTYTEVYTLAVDESRPQRTAIRKRRNPKRLSILVKDTGSLDLLMNRVKKLRGVLKIARAAV